MNAEWPISLTLVRHGQSAGNIASEAAESEGRSLIEIAERDVDVPLSALGERQAAALGEWLRKNPDSQPSLVLTSPYVRARETAAIALKSLGNNNKIETVFDERLREREFGIIDRLTKKGITEKYPFQAELHSRLGKFYYRPPGGESWCDVILRLRSVIDSLSRDYAGEKVMIFCHSVVVYGFRYLLEKMTEEEILKIDRANLMANCGMTSYELGPAGGKARELQLKKFNFILPIEEAGEKITAKEDKPVLPK